MAKRRSNKGESRAGVSRTQVARSRRHGACVLILGRNLRNVLKTPSRLSPYKSFRRSYREDYVRETNVPGLGQHIAMSFGVVFKNYKLFMPLLIISVVIGVLFVGVNGMMTETAGVFGVIIFLVLWLTTIYLLRHLMAKHQVTLRDGLYNAMAPLLSTLVVFVVIVIECIPIVLLVIAYSAAIETDFLKMPFYALLFVGFAVAMILLSGYLLSSSLMALVAVAAPGTYPLPALITAIDLMTGRRIHFILRLIALILVLGVISAVIILPLMALKVPQEVLAVFVTTIACFSGIYMTAYLYLYYRWLLKL